MARTTAESMPPETRTTAFFSGISAARLVVPEDLVQLHLEAYRQAVGNDPVGKLARADLRLAGREQHVAALADGVVNHHAARPVVVGPAADHELDLVVRRQQRDVASEVARLLARARGLDVQDARDAGIDPADVERARGLQRDHVARVAQPAQQSDAALLRQRLAAGHADMAHAVAGDLCKDRVDVLPLAAVEGIGGIAVAAAQRAAGQADEYRRPPGVARLALERQENLGDAEPVRGRGRRLAGPDGGGIHGAYCSVRPRPARATCAGVSAGC